MNVTRTSPVVPLRPAVPVRPAPAPASASGTRSVGASSGLWDLLTPDEQAFFTSQSALGPLTYGPSRGGQTHAPLGGRIDVKG
jgi:hypothetical protein